MSLALYYIFLLCSDLVTLFLLLYSQDEMSVSGSGTVVIRSPRGSQSSALFREPSSLVSFLHFLHSCLHKNIKQIKSLLPFVSQPLILLDFNVLCSLAAHMLLLKMLLPVELLFSVANMMTLILLELQDPGQDFKRELRVHQLKIVQQILQRLFLFFIILDQFYYAVNLLQIFLVQL